MLVILLLLLIIMMIIIIILLLHYTSTTTTLHYYYYEGVGRAIVQQDHLTRDSGGSSRIVPRKSEKPAKVVKG